MPSRLLTRVLSLAALAACSAPRLAALPTVRPAAEPPPATGLLRLPDDVVPLAYNLWFELDPKKSAFKGLSRIVLRLSRPTAVVRMHAQDLHVHAATAVVAGEAQPRLGSFAVLQDDGLAAIRFDRPLPAGLVTLHVQYEGQFNQGLTGLYRVGLHDAAGPAIVSQFEATSARRAFPCFDEPRFKTTFEISVSVPTGLHAIGNTPVRAAQQPSEDAAQTLVTFATTPPLPTYLLALAVGPFDVVAGPVIPPTALRPYAVPLRGVAPAGHGQQLNYVLKHTGQFVAALEAYLGRPYPFDKLDLIAVPDFAAGAMENAGAITFRDTLLLVDERSASTAYKLLLANVLAHELTHQWFGDDVTMPWWDDLWLNEAFATWLGDKVTHTLEPSMRLQEEVLLGVHRAMALDGLPSVRQVRQPVLRPSDIDDAFDSTTYLKGGGILTMFEGFVGAERMAEGISAHLQRFHFGSASATDFVHSLSQQANFDLSPSFASFLNQPGVPLLHFAYTCEAAGARLHIRQTRYAPVGAPLPAAGLWQVPVCFGVGAKGGAQTRQCVMLNTAEATVTLSACPAWLVPNSDATGYYRALQSSQSMAQSWAAPLSARERMAHVANLEAGLAAGMLRPAEILNTVAQAARSDDILVSTAPVGLLQHLHDHVLAHDLPAQQRFSAWVRRIYAAAASRLEAWAPPTTPSERRLQPRLVAFLADVAQHTGLRDSLARAGVAYLGFGGDANLHPEAVPADLADQAVAAAIDQHGVALLEHVLHALQKSEDAGTRRLLVAALTAVRAPNVAAHLQERLPSLALRQNEVLPLAAGALRRPALAPAAWDAFAQGFDQMIDRLPIPHSELPLVASSLCGDADAAKVEAFFVAHRRQVVGYERALAQAKEAIAICTAQRRLHGAALAAALPP